MLLILTWAISWPAIKLGVASMPPLWYACLRYAIATACLLAVAPLRGELAWPQRQDCGPDLPDRWRTRGSRTAHLLSPAATAGIVGPECFSVRPIADVLS